jgi:beta-lactamase regulating signal transducer with metallopeptidase domain
VVKQIEMENDVLKLAASQGVWALLAIVLIFYILKAQEKRDIKQQEREKDYQKIILKLTREFEVIGHIQKDIIEIKEYINNKN